MLQAATVPVVSDWQCFEMTGLLNYEDQVCAGGVGAEASACPGDSGGALQVFKGDSAHIGYRDSQLKAHS